MQRMIPSVKICNFAAVIKLSIMDSEQKTLKHSGRKGWIVAGIAIVVAVVAVAIFAFSHLLKKNTAEPLTTLPADAVYVLQINDNEVFMKSSIKCLPYLDEILSFNALEGFEYFASQISASLPQTGQMVISGHLNQSNQLKLMMSTRASEGAFNQLLQDLKINPKDCSTHRSVRIYKIATHHSTFYLCFHNGIFSAAESVKLLESSIDVTATANALSNQAELKKLLDVIYKNDKHNWLIINHKRFVKGGLSKIAPDYQSQFSHYQDLADWSAYQISFTDFEMNLSGYSLITPNSFFHQFPDSMESPMSIPDSLVCSNISRMESYTAPFTVGADSVVLQFPDIHHFVMNSKDRDLHFIALHSDESDNLAEVFLPSDFTSDSIIRYKKIAIYKSGVGDFVPKCLQDSTIACNYFVENKGNLIFADSVSALKSYLDKMSGGTNLASNQTYVFAKKHLPSQSVFELYYQNLNQDARKFFSASFLKAGGRLSTLRVLSVNARESVDGMVPNNIYVRFQ